MNIRGQINWWQLAVVLVTGVLVAFAAAAQYVAANQAQLAELIGSFAAGGVVAVIASLLALISGRPVKEVANDIVESASGEDINNDGK